MKIIYDVIAYDESNGYEDRSRAFEYRVDAIHYASSLEPKFKAIVLERTMIITSNKIWP